MEESPKQPTHELPSEIQNAVESMRELEGYIAEVQADVKSIIDTIITVRGDIQAYKAGIQTIDEITTEGEGPMLGEQKLRAEMEDALMEFNNYVAKMQQLIKIMKADAASAQEMLHTLKTELLKSAH